MNTQASEEKKPPQLQICGLCKVPIAINEPTEQRTRPGMRSSVTVHSFRCAEQWDDMHPDSTGHVPATEKWEFDESVTQVFDDMLERSIPQYDLMRKTVTDTACHFLLEQPGSHVLDLGASRGEQLAQVIEARGLGKHYYAAVEISDPMFDALKERFADERRAGYIQLLQMDLRREFPTFGDGMKPVAGVVMAVLTMQFIPIEYRLSILAKIHRMLRPGGAFIMVEKILGATSEIDEMMLRQYLTLKNHNGYGREEIERKRLSLEGVLVPVTARMNEEFLKGAGFEKIDCIWRWQNFAGWVAIR